MNNPPPNSQRPPVLDEQPIPDLGTGITSLRTHWIVLILSTIVLVAAVLMTVRDREQVVVPFTDWPLPGLCTFKRATSLDCPGCGLTRCFISLGHGDLQNAWAYNPVGILFFVMVAFQVPYRSWQIYRTHRGRPWALSGRWDQALLYALAGALIVQWIVRLVLSQRS